MKMKEEKKLLVVNIEKGMRHGEKVRFGGEASQRAGFTAGDLVVVLRVKKHATFKRKGAHLFIKQSLSLKDALCGCSFAVKHLDGRTLHLST